MEVSILDGLKQGQMQHIHSLAFWEVSMFAYLGYLRRFTIKLSNSNTLLLYTTVVLCSQSSSSIFLLLYSHSKIGAIVVSL